MAVTGDRLSVSLQENLLVLLCFSDKASALIRNAVEPHLFSTQIYRDVVLHVYDYIDKFHAPPREHVADLLEAQLDGDKNSAMYEDLLKGVYEQRNSVNEEYALSQLEAFVRQQTLKSSIIKASEAIQDGDLDRAEEQLNEGLRTRLKLFSPGISLTEGLRLAYAGQVRRDVVPTGIKEFDDAQLGPGRGEYHLFIGPPKRGKSWWLVHMTKRVLLHRLKVLYITLELSEGQIAQRLLQSLFSIARHKATVPVARLHKDETLGRLLRIEKDTITGRMTIDDASSRSAVEQKLGRLRGRENLIIKQFPAGQLTMRMLVNYLDMLERYAGFIPDMLVIDYPDYMKISPDNYRLELSALNNDLRGLAVERNIGVIAASRANREGAKARLITETHAGEDYSKIYTADTVLTYTQTLPEKELGLARLFASNTRVAERDGFVVLITQAYPIGQFCLDSVPMTESYWGHLEQAAGNTPDKDETAE